MLYQTIRQGKGKIWFSKKDKGFFIEGPILPSKFKLNTDISSQHISGLFMTIPFLKEDSVVFLKNYESSPFVYLTLDILKKANIKIEKVEKSKIEKLLYPSFNEKYIVKGNSKIDFSNNPNAIIIEADWSSASYFMVAAAIGGEILFNKLNIDSKQPDAAILEVLKMAGADITVERSFSSKEEDKILIKRNQLKPFYFDISNCPDIFPSIAILATFCEGKSKIFGIKRLKYKESDRLKSIIENFKLAQIRFEVEKDCLIIFGNPDYIEKKESNDSIILSSFGDHRIFMAFSIFGSFFYKNIKILDNYSYKKSYNNFIKDFISLGGKVEEEDE
jgi:3-phosphoshikimate 1-carboxyvinyltransferase